MAEPREITPLDDLILETFDADAGMRDGLLAVYRLGYKHGWEESRG